MSDSCLEEIDERSTFDIDVAVTDEDGVAVVPSVATYTLMNRDNEVINSIENKAIAVMSILMRVTLADLDLKIESSSSDREYRTLLVKTDRGSAAEPENREYNFWVKNLGIGNA